MRTRQILCVARFLLSSLLFSLCTTLFLAVSIGAAQAQAYPLRLIKFVVPWPAGGATDVIARQLGQALSQQVGQPIVVENKPGAGGNIGTQAFAGEAGRLHDDGHEFDQRGQPAPLLQAQL